MDKYYRNAFTIENKKNFETYFNFVRELSNIILYGEAVLSEVQAIMIVRNRMSELFSAVPPA